MFGAIPRHCFRSVFSCFELVLVYVWGHTEANEGLGNAFRPCPAGLSGLNEWTVPEFPVWTGLIQAPMQMGLVLVMVLVLVSVQAGSIRLG